MTGTVQSSVKTGPVGLGNLVTCGYLKDTNALLCPSADNMRADYGALGAPCSRTALKMLGGFDGTPVTQGNWTAVGTNWMGVTGVCGFQSNYNYRGVPLICNNMNAMTDTFSANIDPITKPCVSVSTGCPQFPSVKLLAGRAIVADTFSKYDQALGGAVTQDVRTGFGKWAHGDGYNVLYGDWSAKFQGDPAQAVANWDQATYLMNGAVKSANDALCSASLASDDDGPGGMGMGSNTGCCPNAAKGRSGTEGFLLWHSFDTQYGIDL